MKYLSFIAISAIIGGFWLSQPNNVEQAKPQIKWNDIELHHYTEPYDMTVIQTKKAFQVLYREHNSSTLKEIAEKESFRVLINSSYFASYPPDATPAGLFKVNNQIISPMLVEANLTYVVRYNSQIPKLEIIKNDQYIPENNKQLIEFQSGPLLYANGKITTDSINESTHGNGKYMRTILAFDSENNFFFITIRTPVMLKEATEAILKLPIMKNRKLQIINLDGGPSVASYVAGFLEYNFRENSVLPLFFGIK